MHTVTFVRKAAVLGAGVMGAQIAAHLANAGVEVMLFDLAVSQGDPNAEVVRALAGLTKLEPAPLATRDRIGLITPANYDHHLESLRTCDLVIEAIAEQVDLKEGLYARVAPFIADHALFVTNTSGLGIHQLARALPESLRHRFCGVHFFNPPRYMALAELIPARSTDPRVLDFLETFLTTTLGKGVVRAKDTPNFIANRVGVFSLMSAMHHTAALGLGLDLVDALTGPAIGRPKSATYRTADVVGLDTLRHVVEGSAQALPDDPWVGYLKLPGWIRALIEQGALGQKTGRGIYRKQDKQIQVLDLSSGGYRPAGVRLDVAVASLLDISDAGQRLGALRASDHPQARFVWAILRDVFHYSAVLLEEIADNARDLDLAIRWGFGWRMGPFETWQAAGWSQVTDWLQEDIDAGRALTSTPLPGWVTRVDRVHKPAGSYAVTDGVYRPRSKLPVYRRQPFPETLWGEAKPVFGETSFENPGVRLWHTGDEVAVLSFKSKMHVIGDDVLDGIVASLSIAERDFRGLVIWQTEPPFSFGADLAEALPVLQVGDFDTLDKHVAKFQRMTQALRFASIPVVAAVQGLALGGGCEVLMQCDRVVAALESYIGLVEVGVGLLPAAGGCKEFTRRAALEAPDAIVAMIGKRFETVAMGKVSKSAEHARELGYLRPGDIIVFHPREVLHVAKVQLHALAESGYRPPARRAIKVAGRAGIANLRMVMTNMHAGGFISQHDLMIGEKIAQVLCGGDLDAGMEVSEDWLLALERKAIVALAKTDNTQVRIAHTLKTGKPLRN